MTTHSSKHVLISAAIAVSAAMATFAIPHSADAAIQRFNHINTKLDAAQFANPFAVTTSSFTPPSNSLLVVVIGAVASDADVRTGLEVSGGGLTWTKRVNGTGTQVDTYYAQSEIWTAPVTTGASMSITVDDDNANGSDSDSGVQIQVFSFTGYNTASPIGATGSKDPMAFDGADSFNLSGAPQTSSAVLASVFSFDNGTAENTFLSGAGWTEIQEGPGTGGYGNMQTQIASSSAPTSVAWSDLDHSGSASANTMIGLAIEIRAAAGNSTLVRPPNNLGLVGYWSFNEGTGRQAISPATAIMGRLRVARRGRAASAVPRSILTVWTTPWPSARRRC